MVNSPTFFLSVKILIFPSNLKEPLWTEYSWLYFLPFHHFKYIMPFLACKVSAEKKSSNCFIEIPLYIRSCFFCWHFYDSLFNFWHFNYNMCGSFWIPLSGTLWDYWIEMFVSFPRLGKFLAIIFSNKISSSLKM